MKVFLPDGRCECFADGAAGSKIAEMLHLHNSALAVEIDGTAFDLSHIITEDARVVTNCDGDCAHADSTAQKLSFIRSDSSKGLELIRHSCAHLLASAVKELYPEAKIAIGPAINDGFYYDFCSREPFTPETIELIEARMHEILKRGAPFVRRELSRKEAVDLFKGRNEDFKVELVNDLPSDAIISTYSHGNFTDLCRGPHVPVAGDILSHFKLTKVSGAYWRGDSSKPMLQRIYGTAWATKAALDLYVKRLEEAEARDHHKLGREMDLFHIQEEAVGSIFWHPNGCTLFRLLEDFIRRRITKHGYKEVKTPHLIDRSLWEKSGHWEKYRDAMFIAESEKRVLAVKPMNCPGHIQIFNQGLRSYRQLPYRIAEFGVCHRNEPSGSLYGLMRVRSFVQDDGHILCTAEQVGNEVKDFCDLLISVYRDLGFSEIFIKFADRPKVRAGDDATWDLAEKMLRDAIKGTGLDFEYSPGEGAFYGPKIEFGLNDALGRYWQCGTLQMDMVLPERLSAEYMGEDGNRHRPIMLHRAILGSLERFIGILLEHYAGKLPKWLMPAQAMIVPVMTDTNGYAEKVTRILQDLGVRCQADLRSESAKYKIREHSVAKIPLMVMLGPKEEENQTITTRWLGDNDNQKTLSLKEAERELIEAFKAP
ncbi:MAG: threonine--tRNA ligase [Holosporales bacterium]|jgi:threonyl-tRNA synthetase|nr:threonine--tRNA ligase [Holosporales bacterium]